MAEQIENAMTVDWWWEEEEYGAAPPEKQNILHPSPETGLTFR